MGEGGEDIETDGDSRVEWTYKETEKKAGNKATKKAGNKATNKTKTNQTS